MPEQRLFEMSVDLLAVAGFDGYFTRVNPAWHRVLGWTEDELLSIPYVELFHPEDLQRGMDELEKLTTTGDDSLAVEIRLRCKDGSYRWLRGSIHPDLDTRELMISATDVTVRKQIEERLQFRVTMEELVASISSGLFTADPTDIAREVEHGLGRLAQLLGADRAHLVRVLGGAVDERYVEWCGPGIEPARADVGNPSPAVRRWWIERLRSGEPFKATNVDEIVADDPDVGRVLVEDRIRSILIVPLRARRATGFVGLTTVTHERDFDEDATALIRVAGETFLAAFDRADTDAALVDAAHELEQRNRELERSNEDLERFAFAAAHDLKAPLARIEMAVSALDLHAPGLGDDQRALLEVAKRGATRMRTLIEDLLAYATAGGGAAPAQPVDLEAVVQQVVTDLVDLAARTGATVEVRELPTVMGHRSMLSLLLQNLVSNAMKFGREGVLPRVTVDAEPEGRGWIISVTDNGIGIPEDQREAVFAMFTRLHTEEQYAGSGIGLATCAKVASLHGGRIWVEPAPGGGTRVRLSLPR